MSWLAAGFLSGFLIGVGSWIAWLEVVPYRIKIKAANIVFGKKE